MKTFYSETIPVALVNKLQDAGMQVAPYDNYMPTYAEVLDWLSEKGYEVEIRLNLFNTPEWWSHVLHLIDSNSTESVQAKKNGRWLYTFDWHEAANASIETGLEMLKK